MANGMIMGDCLRNNKFQFVGELSEMSYLDLVR